MVKQARALSHSIIKSWTKSLWSVAPEVMNDILDKHITNSFDNSDAAESI